MSDTVRELRQLLSLISTSAYSEETKGILFEFLNSKIASLEPDTQVKAIDPPWMKEFKTSDIITQKEMADHIGKSISWISSRIKNRGAPQPLNDRIIRRSTSSNLITGTEKFHYDREEALAWLETFKVKKTRLPLSLVEAHLLHKAGGKNT